MAKKRPKLRPYQQANLKEYNKVRGMIKRQITMAKKQGWVLQPEYYNNLVPNITGRIPTKKDIKNLLNIYNTKAIYKYGRIPAMDVTGNLRMVTYQENERLKVLWRGRSNIAKKYAKQGISVEWDEQGNEILTEIPSGVKIDKRQPRKKHKVKTITIPEESGDEQYYSEAEAILNWVLEALDNITPDVNQKDNHRRTSAATDYMHQMINEIKSYINQMLHASGDYELYSRYLKKKAKAIAAAVENFRFAYYKEEIAEYGYQLIDIITGRDMVRDPQEGGKSPKNYQQAINLKNMSENEVYEAITSKYTNPATGEISKTEEAIRKEVYSVLYYKRRLEAFDEMMSELAGFDLPE